MVYQKEPLDKMLKYRKNSRSTFLQITNSNSSYIARIKALGGDMLT